MHVQVLTVNHDTTSYLELMLRSLIVHHPDRSWMSVLILDNDSEDLDSIGWAEQYGFTIERTGFSRQSRVNTHGEILRAAVLGHPNCDAYLFVDPDIYFLADNTLGAMATTLEASGGVFAVEATFEGEGTVSSIEPRHFFVREQRRLHETDPWQPALEYCLCVGDRVVPFCTLIRNDDLFRRAVELVGLSGAHHESLEGGMYWDTLGLLTQVMKTHNRRKAICEQAVVHFGSVSYCKDKLKCVERDRMLAKYRELCPLPEERKSGCTPQTGIRVCGRTVKV
jgi:hypothetical protein